MKKYMTKDSVKSYLLILIGITMVGLGVHFFHSPFHLAVGGAYGIGVVLSEFTGLQPGDIMLIVNGVLFILAFLLIGASFGVKTILASLGTSGVVKILEFIAPNPQSLSGDIMLDLICGVILSAIGIGIVFNQGASTGGTDILGKIVNKFTGIDIGKAVLYCDFLITLGATLAYGPKTGLYSLFGVVINGLIIDYVIDGMNIAKEVTIVADDPTPIVHFIHNELIKTCTLYDAHGAYSGKPKQVIVTILDRRSYVQLKEFLKSSDQKIFTWIKNSSEVHGEGFRAIE